MVPALTLFDDVLALFNGLLVHTVHNLPHLGRVKVLKEVIV